MANKHIYKHHKQPCSSIWRLVANDTNKVNNGFRNEILLHETEFLLHFLQKVLCHVCFLSTVNVLALYLNIKNVRETVLYKLRPEEGVFSAFLPSSDVKKGRLSYITLEGPV
jgi:hypothetical protein